MSRNILRFCFIAILMSNCSEDEEGLTAYDESVIEYFSEVALGFEFGNASAITRKWTDDMKIFVGGNKDTELMDELDAIITEVNTLATDGFNISVVSDTLQSNFYIFFGSGVGYAAIFPEASNLIDDNWGLFTVYWQADDQINRGKMYVDIYRADPAGEKHLLREELTQSLGLAKDSDRYSYSIFHQGWTTTTIYADIDRDLIRLLYHPSMQIGLDQSHCEELLREIILSEK